MATLSRAKLRAPSRRRVLTGLAAGAAVLAAGRMAEAACLQTAHQVDGPFYPITVGEQDWDLTHIAGGNGRAEGEVIEVTGQVRDVNCNPLQNCVIEVWQANRHGRYSHPLDTAEQLPLDPNFDGYARITTDNDGAYRFLTIVPGSYVALGDWIRPPHIHFKVHAPLNPSVTTQMYFEGDPLNDKDLLQAPLSPAERAALRVSFDTVRADGVRSGVFDPILPAGWTPPEGMVIPGQEPSSG